jgi:tetratricopeptide (TPR) repeat protein
MDTLGWIYHLLGHHWKAVPELERAVERMPEEAIFRYHLGKACYANKDLQKAKLHLSKALELDPASEHAPEARVLVTKIEEEAAAAEETAEGG